MHARLDIIKILYYDVISVLLWGVPMEHQHLLSGRFRSCPVCGGSRRLYVDERDPTVVRFDRHEYPIKTSSGLKQFCTGSHTAYKGN